MPSSKYIGGRSSQGLKGLRKVAAFMDAVLS